MVAQKWMADSEPWPTDGQVVVDGAGLGWMTQFWFQDASQWTDKDDVGNTSPQKDSR
jgi:hypothetical protein